jgi:anti-anti-sigma regulatory factor
MRSAGAVQSARGLGPHDHLCWPYDDTAEFRERALEFLAEGVALGQRVAYIGEAASEELLADLRRLDGIDELLERGGAGVVSVGEMYQAGTVIGPEAQVAAYALATDHAVSNGYRGLRVAAEATALVRTPAQRDAFLHYEHLIDRSMRSMPFAALCGYHRPELGDDVVSELACMHPLAPDEASLFRVFASDDSDVAVAGEVDTMGAERFARALGRALGDIGSERLTIDASELTFIDHNGLLVLDRLARAAGASVVLRHARSVAARLADALDLEAVQIEAVHIETGS